MSKKDTDANDYRVERKKRLAKDTKKKNKSKLDSVKIVTIIVSVISAAAIISLIAFGLYQFGVPQKFMPAVKVAGKTYSVAEYGFYYSSVFQSYAEQSQNPGFASFDHKKDPALQTTTDEDGNKVTYDELIRKNAIKSLETQNYYLDKCKNEGIVLSDEKQAEINKTINDIAQYAQQYGYSTSRYISLIYGKGLNEKVFRSLLSDQFLVAQYIETQEKECFDNISKDELEKAYNENASKYQAIDIRLFGFEKETEALSSSEETTAAAEETTAASEETTAAAEETSAVSEETTATSEETTAASEETTATVEKPKEPSKQELLADEMLKKITDEQSFNKLAHEYADEEDKDKFKDDNATLIKNIKQSLVETNIGKDISEWLFSSERVVGDKTVYSADNYVYVIYIVKTAYRNDEPLVDARHILVSFEDTAASLKEKEENRIDIEHDDDKEIKTTTTDDAVEITNEGTGYSIELVTETYKSAHNIYMEFVSGEQTEEAFAELADKYSADKGSAGKEKTGGLYENIEKGKMVKPFEDWVYDEKRQPGNVDLVMTNYGWHIIYFVKKHDAPAWEEDVRASLGSEAFSNIQKEVEEAVAGTAKTAAFAKFAGNEARKLMTKLYAEKPV